MSLERAADPKCGRPRLVRRGLALVALVAIAGVAMAQENAQADIFSRFHNTFDQVQSAANSALIDFHNPFFDAVLGTNGQSCSTCHQPDQAMTIEVARVRHAFEATQGLDPLFRLPTSADRPDADVGCEESIGYGHWRPERDCSSSHELIQRQTSS